MKRYLLRQRLRQRDPRVPRGFSETATEITRRFPPHVFQSRQDIAPTLNYIIARYFFFALAFSALAAFLAASEAAKAFCLAAWRSSSSLSR
jgi:hypothetical protein